MKAAVEKSQDFIFSELGPCKYIATDSIRVRGPVDNQQCGGGAADEEDAAVERPARREPDRRGDAEENAEVREQLQHVRAGRHHPAHPVVMIYY